MLNIACLPSLAGRRAQARVLNILSKSPAVLQQAGLGFLKIAS